MRHLLIGLLTSALCLLSLPAWSQEEDPSVEEGPETTPTPSPPPVEEMPEYHETTASGTGDDENNERLWLDQTSGLFGLGIALGTTSGVSGKVWITPAHGVQFALGAGPTGNHLRFSLDYLYHWRLVDVPDRVATFPFYVGLGASAGFIFDDPTLRGATDSQGNPVDRDRVDVGVRVPVGMSVIIGDVPVEMSMEVAPNVVFYEDFVLYVDGGLSIRFYF